MTETARESIQCQDFDALAQFQQAKKSGKTWGGCDLIRSIAACPRFLRVLILDDYRDSADTMAMVVKLWGHVVQVAYDGAAALNMIPAFQPDVLLLDIAMPGLDGFQLAQQLRRETCCKDSLLIAMTGYADKANRHQWEGAFDLYLVKPMELSTLRSLLMLEQKRLEKRPETLCTTQQQGIMVVDDEECVRSVLNIALRLQGFAVRLAASGAEALDLYRSHRETIDLILLDVRMPGLDGPQTLGALKELNPEIRCCFMSGDCGSYTAEELRSLGAASVFPKPFRLDDMVYVLRELTTSTNKRSYVSMKN